MGRCGRRVLCAVQAGVGIAFWAISMPAARSTGVFADRRPPGCPRIDDRTRIDLASRATVIAIMTTALSRAARRRIAHRGPFQREPVRAMDEPIADRIGDRRVANGRVPRGRRELAGNERRRPFAPIFDHLQQVPPLGIGERRQQPIVNRQQIELREFGQEPTIRCRRRD